MFAVKDPLTFMSKPENVTHRKHGLLTTSFAVKNRISINLNSMLIK